MATSTANQSGWQPDPEPLPLRWFVILAFSGATGVVVGAITDVGAGVATTLAMVGLLHVILGR
ncbi:hypothetical protein ACFO5K_13465 [Nocardia halotolerans]|uniref:Uncharacterized protein n=1 Tax=Nocardia halotolerans TaxID=1755878 RepID=A0ABV8VH65_9NOCA